MKAYLLLAASLALASCATHKHLTQPLAPASLPTSGGRDEAARPNGVIVAREPSALDKLLGRTPKPWVVQPIVASRPIDIGNGPAPRKCKGCTFNLVNGNQTVAGKKANLAAGANAVATTVGKVKAPTAIGDSAAAVDNTKAGQRGGAAAMAPGATATATTEKAGFPWWLLAIPVVAFVGYRKFIAG
jgi:hypothetical protein